MKLSASLLVATLALAPVAHSALIVDETFDSYLTGQLVGQGGWTENVAGPAAVASSPSAFSAPHVMTLHGGAAVQRSFSETDLTLQPTVFSFHFQLDSKTAGQNIQLSLRTGTSGSGSLLYLNLLGNGNGLFIGTSSGTTTQQNFASSLETGTWYTFTATTDPGAGTLLYSVAASSGGTDLVAGNVNLSGTDLKVARMVFSSNASTSAGMWQIDNVRYEAIPEPGTVALALGGIGLLALYQRSRRRTLKGDR